MKKVMIALLTAAGLAPAMAHAAIPQIQHVVVMVQENRTPDNLFCGFKSKMPGANISCMGKKLGRPIRLTPVPLAESFDPGHGWMDFKKQFNNGTGDGPVGCNIGPCPQDFQYKYVQPADVQPYFEIASQYGFANQMFQSNRGPSFPAHIYLISGTSEAVGDADFLAAGNPQPGGGPTGCLASENARVVTLGPDGRQSKEYPCFEHQTLMDLLDNPPGVRHPISWRYYTQTAGHLWTAPNAIQHICQPDVDPATHKRICKGQMFVDNVVTDPRRVLTDIKGNALPAVSWVIPPPGHSDHPANGGGGPAWVASVVNAIGSNKNYWRNTAILITWDDWGGWYDHVIPPTSPTNGQYEFSFRVPLLVVSAYTPAGYISQPRHTFGSILRFIEQVYDLPTIPPGTYDDSTADNLTDFFDFSMAARKFKPISGADPSAFSLAKPMVGVVEDRED